MCQSQKGSTIQSGRDVFMKKQNNEERERKKPQKKTALPLKMKCLCLKNHTFPQIFNKYFFHLLCLIMVSDQRRGTVVCTQCLHYVARKQYLMPILQLLHNQRSIMFRQFSSCAKKQNVRRVPSYRKNTEKKIFPCKYGPLNTS